MSRFGLRAHRAHPILLVALVIALSSCSGDDTASSSGGTSGGAGSSGSSGAASSGGMAVGGVPTSAAALNAYLQKKEYSSWAKESAPHKSTGPHGSLVLTYLNPALDASLKAGGAEHPLGSASVKEFYTGAQVSGWAAYVKTQASSDGGKGWYWYEVFSTAPGASAIEGQGSGTCTGCHSQGKDYVRIPYPLQ